MPIAYFALKYNFAESILKQLLAKTAKLQVKSHLSTVWSSYIKMETVGRAIPCFRHGTDYILNLKVEVLWRIMRTEFFSCYCNQEFRILVLPRMWQPMSRYTAVGLLHIPLGIALSYKNYDLGFTDKARFSLVCCHTRRLIINRTHVQKHRHLSIYECSQYISISLTVPPIDWHPGSQSGYALPLTSDGDLRRSPLRVSP